MEELVDLSLFEWNPSGASTAQGVSSGTAEYYQPVISDTREFYAPSPRENGFRETADIQEAIRRSVRESCTPSEPELEEREAAVTKEGNIRETIVDASRRREVTMKPLPALPRTRICQQVAEDGSQCILKRIKGAVTDQSIPSPGSLLQRRNGNATPQLTLSVPHESPRPPVTATTRSNSNRDPSPMVWMPDEQMWLVVGEPEQLQYSSATARHASYPTPPAYTPRASARSEPVSRVQSQWDLTPPQTPIQSQLQSLLQPRDEERLSPLFQEAMNSVPMTDTFDLPPPPSYEGLVGRSPPAWTQVRPLTSMTENYPSFNRTSPHNRAQTTTLNQRPRGGSDTTAERSSCQRPFTTRSSSHSYHHQQTLLGETAPSSSSFQPVACATRSWHGLAQKLARPRSTT